MSLENCWLHGENLPMWLNRLKTAVVTEDVEKVSKLLKERPELNTREMEEASYLLREAALIAQRLRDETAKTMKKVKKSIDFLHSTESKKVQQLDITS